MKFRRYNLPIGLYSDFPGCHGVLGEEITGTNVPSSNSVMETGSVITRNSAMDSIRLLTGCSALLSVYLGN